jgi:PAS domain S-box-containing protein
LRIRIKILLAIGVLALMPSAPCRAETTAPYRVLILHSTGRDFPPFEPATREFRTELVRISSRPVEFIDASLDMARLDGADNEGPLTSFLAAIHQGAPPDLVAAVGAPAYYYWTRNRDAIAPNTPILVVGADNRRLPDLEEDQLAVGANVIMDLQIFPKHVTRLLPRTRHMYIALGTAPLEQFWENEIRRSWPELLPDTQLHWLSQLPMDELLARVADLPPDSAIFYVMISRDVNGMPYLNEDCLERIHQVANAPVFGYSSAQMGLGIIGGPQIDMIELGRGAARAGSRLLAGELPSDVAVPVATVGAPVYDWRELKKWGIPEAQLPADARVLYRPPSLWETHRNLAIAAILVVVVQSLLITRLIATRRRVVESDASLRLTTEAANIGLWNLDPENKAGIECSQRWRKLLGLSDHALVRLEDVYQRIHPDDRASVKQAIDQAADVGGKFEIEHRVLCHDGTVRWINSRGQAVAGRTRGISMDITRRRETEEQLDRQRNELAHLSRVVTLGELSCALAHELNQPLGSILSNAQAAQRMLPKDKPELEEIHEILADIVSEDRRAGNVIKRLRALLERGEVDFQALDFDECLDEVLELMRAELAPQGVAVDRLRANPPARVMADRVQLQQVFLNLITNARDAMDGLPPARRVLTIQTTTADGQVRLDVRDAGHGFLVDPEKLFEPFHTTKKHGLGMGLPICRSIIEAHKGSLIAENAQPHGAVFRLSLPAIDPS